MSHLSTSSLLEPSLPDRSADTTSSTSSAIQTQDSPLSQYWSRFHQMKTKFFLKQFAFSWWKVNILTNALSAMSCPVDLVIVPSSANQQEFFCTSYSTQLNRISIAADAFWNPFKLRRALAHELTLAFDFARAKINPSNPDHIACTEIRGYNMSGECDMWTRFAEYTADDLSGTQWWSRKQRCIKEHTFNKMRKSSKFQDPEIHQSIDHVFGRCFKDHWPFTTQPHMDTRYRDSPMVSRM